LQNRDRTAFGPGHISGVPLFLSFQQDAESHKDENQYMNKSSRRAEPREPELKRILVVDDEGSIRELLKAHLEGEGYHVTTTESGAEGLRLALKLPLHLIITDVHLGDADGIDLLKRLKKISPLRPVIVMTGYSEADSLATPAMEAGAAAFVCKSNPMGDLLAKIKELLDGAPEPTPGSEDPSADQTPSPDAAESQENPESPGNAGDTPQPSLSAPPEAPEPKPPFIATETAITPDGEQLAFGMEVFGRMLATTHPNLGYTAKRAVAVCKALGESLQLPPDQQQSLLWAAALHDIGLVRIERHVVNQWLRNPEKTEKKDLIQIQKHPSQSAQMLEFCTPLKGAAEIVQSHHEHWDGTGFPAGLRMEMIPWLSRLLSAVLFYCAEDHPSPKTVERMNLQADHALDPRAVEAVSKVVTNLALPPGERELMAYELRAGMVLAEDICSWDGVLVAGRGTELNSHTASRISHLSAAGETDPHVLIIV
jgi:response regulator RpfG family c-di-GMP phosphodiesterase